MTPEPILPRYPVYIPSKARADKPATARMFDRAGVPYKIVVQPDQVEAYAEWRDRDMLLVLPEDDKGLVYARNWIKDHAVEAGAARHWQFDDDIHMMRYLYDGYRVPVSAAVALAMIEDFVEQYENVVLASPDSMFFVPVTGTSRQQIPPFAINQRCYTAFLMDNSLPNRWRYRYNEDTDMTLQVLADGWCTMLFKAVMIHTEGTESNSTGNVNGGGQAAVYAGDGRLKMARDLERVWPGVVETKRRFNRPQHVVKGSWTKFDTKPIRRADAPPIRDYGLMLKQSADEVKSAELRALLEANRNLQPQTD